METRIRPLPKITDGKGGKPNLPIRLFWDVRHSKMNWRRAYVYVIQRVLDRGTEEELEEMIRFYGQRKVLFVLKKVPIFLMDHSIERACVYFKLKPEELLCYVGQKAMGAHWP